MALEHLMDCGKCQHERKGYIPYFSTRDLCSVQRVMNAHVHKPREYDADKNGTARMPDIDHYLSPQIRYYLCYPGDFDEVNSGDSKNDPVHYLYLKANKKINQTFRISHFALFD